MHYGVPPLVRWPTTQATAQYEGAPAPYDEFIITSTRTLADYASYCPVRRCAGPIRLRDSAI